MLSSIETWDEMIARHQRERREVLQSLSESGYTQTQAAQILQKPLSFINGYAKKYGVVWKVKAQGRKQSARYRNKSSVAS